MEITVKRILPYTELIISNNAASIQSTMMSADEGRAMVASLLLAAHDLMREIDFADAEKLYEVYEKLKRGK